MSPIYLSFRLFVLWIAVFGHTVNSAVVLPRGQSRVVGSSSSRPRKGWRMSSSSGQGERATLLSGAVEQQQQALSTQLPVLPRDTEECHDTVTDTDDDDDDDTVTTTTTTTSTTATKSSSRNVLLTVGLSALALLAGPAKLGLLPGPLLQPVTEFVPYTDARLWQDMGTTALTAVLGYIFVKLVTMAADRQWLQPRDSRKIIHTCSAPLFMLFWPLFSSATGVQWFAATVPILNAVRLWRAATLQDDTSLSQAVSRSGNAQEALGGPFIYVILMATNILLFWRSSPVAIVALSTLAAGDGVADLVGRRWGKGNAWPGLDKSVAGSVAFWIASWATSLGLLAWMQYWDCLALPWSWTAVALRLALVTLLSAVVELIPIADDNYTVPLSAALGTLWLLPV